MFAKVISETLNVRSSPKVASNIIATLGKGQVVTLKGLADGASKWAVIEHDGREAYASRRFLAQSPDGPTLPIDAETERLISKVILAASERYDGIAYRLGCKAKAHGTDKLVFSGTDIAGRACSGTTVDCSGWIAGLFQLIAANVNAAYGSVVFSPKDVSRLMTHSDGQIVGVGRAAGQICSGIDIDAIELRSGLIFGLNNGDYDWEGDDRVFGIDHIVMGVNGEDGFHITQSSSSGGGVNLVPWKTWRRSNASRFADYRVHCVDLLATGKWVKLREMKKSPPLELETEPYDAAPG